MTPSRALDFARAAKDLQMLYPALAFRARSFLAAGSPAEAETVAEELLELWGSKGQLLPASSWVADLAYVLHPLGRGLELQNVAAFVGTQTRWLDAAVAFATGDFCRDRQRSLILRT